MQYQLFNTNNKTKELQRVEISKLSISELNPRRTRPQEYIDKLTHRIEQNGFEITRALWVYGDDNGYKVFAGGTRLQAAQAANLTEVPCVVYIGFTEEEIVRLADEDNENDEYHAPVSLVDVWMSYKALADAGWTQERIATAKGVSQPQVAKRLKYADLPQSVMVLIQKENLTEGHVAEIAGLFNLNNLFPFITRETAMLWVIDNALKKEKPTAKDFAKYVSQINELVKLVESYRNVWEEKWFTELLNTIKGMYATVDIQRAIDNITRKIVKDKREAEENARAAANKAEQQRIKAEAEERIALHRMTIDNLQPGQWCKLGQHLLYCGDTSSPEFYQRLPNNIKFAFADPPYNAQAAEWDSDFEWNHDWLSEYADIVAVTPGISSIFEFAKVTTMPYKWSIATWITNGMTRGALGFGNWIYTALFSKLESIHQNIQDFIKVTIKTSQTEDTSHKGRKPQEMLEHLIGVFSKPGELIVDPFLGSGTTLFAAEVLNRRCIGGEISPDFCKDIIRRWEAMTQQEADIAIHTI